jgi:starvation-inducible DNA-binding protein
MPSTDRTRNALDGAVRLYATKNDLPEASRAEAITLLNNRLADAIDLQTACKQAHWNVKGPQFIALHKLFDEINEDVEDYVDLIAERAVQLGGIAEGTARVAAQRSTLLDYPLTIATGEEHVAALSDTIEEMNELEDAGSADIFTEISRGVDKWLWFVEAHAQQASAERAAGIADAVPEGRQSVRRTADVDVGRPRSR